MKITYDQALNIAKDYIKSREISLQKIEPDNNLILGNVVEFDEGWMFHFVSKKYLETKDIQHRLIGSGPVIVGKENGDVYQGGSGYTEDEWIEQFKELIHSNLKS